MNNNYRVQVLDMINLSGIPSILYIHFWNFNFIFPNAQIKLMLMLLNLHIYIFFFVIAHNIAIYAKQDIN